MQHTDSQYIFVSASAEDFLTLNNNIRLPLATRLHAFDIGVALDDSLHIIDCILEWPGLPSRTTMKFEHLADLVHDDIMTCVLALQGRFSSTAVDGADKLKRTYSRSSEEVQFGGLGKLEWLGISRKHPGRGDSCITTDTTATIATMYAASDCVQC